MGRLVTSFSLTLSAAMVLLAASLPARADESPLWQSVVITEFMVNPAGVSSGAGQWIELHNPGAATVNLQGMVLTTVSGGLHVISQAVAVPLGPGQYMVLGRSADQGVNGGAKVDYSYGGDLTLDPASDVIHLFQSGNSVDSMTYGGDMIAPVQGRTIQLEPWDPSGQAVKHWCYGRIPYGALGNFGTPGSPDTDCDDDKDGWAEDQGDCDDGNPGSNPGAKEVCNGIDDDCNGLKDDGLGAPPGDLPPCLTAGACAGTNRVCAGIEGWVCNYPMPLYEPDETTCDGQDNDCDGLTDEPPSGMSCLDKGVCSGVSPICMAGQGFQCLYPPDYQETEVLCDGKDNDCDGETDDGTDVGAPCVTGLGACAAAGSRKCSGDGSGAVCSASPGVPSNERCGDGIDNDCDGFTDEGFPVGEVCTAGEGMCKTAGKYRCSADGLGVACEAVPGKPGAEICSDGADNDCDGETDEADCVKGASGGGGCSGVGDHGSGLGMVGFMLLLWLSVSCSSSPARSRSGPQGKQGTPLSLPLPSRAPPTRTSGEAPG